MSTIKCNNRAPTALTEIGNDYKILKSSYLKNDTNYGFFREIVCGEGI